MTPQTQAWLATGLKWLAELNEVAKVATGSEGAKVISALVPGAAQIIADVRIAEGAIDVIEDIAPTAQALLPMIVSLAHSVGMTPEQTAALRQSRIDEANRTGM